MTTITDETILHLTRLFDASPEAVFDAWMTHESFQAWIGPEGVSCDVPVFEPREGGRYVISMKMSDGRTIPTEGVFRTIERPTKLVFTWGWQNMNSLVTLTFTAKGGKTEFTLTQEGLGSIESRDNHGRGWSSALNKLERFVTTGKA